jgi:TIR domain
VRVGDHGEYDYDACLSFAGERRAYVEEVAEALRERGLRVFYDGYEQATLWGKDLYSHLARVYGEAARYCVLFVSAEYAEKVWTNHERRSAQARALRENVEYILPARFDDTELPGLLPTIGYVDLRHLAPSELAALIAEKVGPRPGPAAARTPDVPPDLPLPKRPAAGDPGSDSAATAGERRPVHGERRARAGTSRESAAAESGPGGAAEFHRAMLDVFRRAKSEAGYNAAYFLRMVQDVGGLEAARRLLRAGSVSSGFTTLWEKGRLDLSVEAVVLQDRFAELFTDEELDIARNRLAEYGYDHLR